MAELGDKNPNEYDDEEFLKADIQLVEAVQNLWDAGGDVEDIEGSLKIALENVE